MNRSREEKVHIFQPTAQENHYAKDSTESKWTLLKFLSSIPDLEKKRKKNDDIILCTKSISELVT